jgi:hypothetical protein
MLVQGAQKASCPEPDEMLSTYQTPDIINLKILNIMLTQEMCREKLNYKKNQKKP